MKNIKAGKEGLVIQWIGPDKKSKKYGGYIRFELCGDYVGTLTDRQARKLMNALKKYYGSAS